MKKFFFCIRSIIKKIDINKITVLLTKEPTNKLIGRIDIKI